MTSQTRSWELSPTARTLYLSILYGAKAQPGDQALQELLDFGLIVPHPHGPEGAYIPLPPSEAAGRRRDALLHQIAEAMTGTARLPEHVQDLAIAYQAHRAQAEPEHGGIEHLAGVELINARISELVAQTTREIIAAQPGGARPAATLKIALSRDLDALRRGVTLHTLYEDSARTDQATAAWCTEVTEAGAHVRTTSVPFMRAVILDRRVAVLPDTTPWVGVGEEPIRALIVHDPGLVAYVAAMHDRDWDRASVWRGRVGAVQRLEPEPAALTQRQREIARHLVAGASQSAVATAVGLSERAVQGEIAAMRRALGADSAVALGYALAREAKVRTGRP
ncbi:LuxR C-terminal-related transcriptional regulator [Streptomyces sp. NRRL B-24484]|uniref:LuxR C-terminal-related transcriptional regulator n=1 Tax=Streptomyces sp. NRRL B-24484 TaxID=1463833 RepID=UPI0004C1C068|nr:LuxR C-terminal-related transcriptional regulator [Streptomyces sp. NRRL B-24484]